MTELIDISSPVFDTLPAGYRWADENEAENWTETPGIIQVRVGGTDDDPWTDLAVPTLWHRYKTVLLAKEAGDRL
jgi:hypothetical protein